jgi:hypothetical protein
MVVFDVDEGPAAAARFSAAFKDRGVRTRTEVKPRWWGSYKWLSRCVQRGPRPI